MESDPRKIVNLHAHSRDSRALDALLAPNCNRRATDREPVYEDSVEALGFWLVVAACVGGLLWLFLS